MPKPLIPFHVLFREAQHERLREYAFEHRLTIADVVRQAVDEYLAKKKPGK
jgi:hypothetical protein